MCVEGRFAAYLEGTCAAYLEGTFAAYLEGTFAADVAATLAAWLGGALAGFGVITHARSADGTIADRAAVTWDGSCVVDTADAGDASPGVCCEAPSVHQEVN